MSEIVLNSLIGAGQAITLALIGLVGVRLGKVKTNVGSMQNDVARVKADAAAARTNSAAARVQVENNHDTNFREESDSRHSETKSWIDDLRSAVTDEIRTLRADVSKDIGGMRQELRDDRQAMRALEGRVTTIEQKEL